MDREEYLELVKMNTGIEITSVESSNIEGIGYNVKKHHLWVSFKNNKVYRYDKVLKFIKMAIMSPKRVKYRDALSKRHDK